MEFYLDSLEQANIMLPDLRLEIIRLTEENAKLRSQLERNEKWATEAMQANEQQLVDLSLFYMNENRSKHA